MANLVDFEPMGERERADLEAEAGRPFASDEAAHRYRLRRLLWESVDRIMRPRIPPKLEGND